MVGTERMIFGPNEFVDRTRLGVPLEMPRRIEDVDAHERLGDEEARTALLERISQGKEGLLLVATCRTKVATMVAEDGYKSIDRQDGQKILEEVMARIGYHKDWDREISPQPQEPGLWLVTRYGPQVYWSRTVNTYVIATLPNLTLVRNAVTTVPGFKDDPRYILEAEWSLVPNEEIESLVPPTG